MGEKSALKGKSETGVSGQQFDSVQKETLAVSATYLWTENTIVLLLQKRRHSQTEENP